MSETGTIFHIAKSADLAAMGSGQAYRCASLDTEGFIHCCDRHQLRGVVSRYYADVDDVQLMLIDVDKLDVPLVHENTVGGSELFPHLYGPVNAEAITQCIPFGIESVERQGLFE